MAASAGLEATRDSVPEAEWMRFLNARDGDQEAAAQMLREHLAWREATLPLAPGTPSLGSGLPPLLVCDGSARSGHRLMVMMAAMYDPSLAADEVYVNAIAAKFDEALDRTSSEKLTVLADVRGGEGWANPAATSAIPFLRAVASLMAANFPERLHQLIVFPVPWVASTLWTVVKQFLDPKTASKVVLLDGSADRKAPVPASLGEYLDEEALATIASHRIAGLALPTVQ